MGHQPLAVAWPAAFLERAGYAPAVLDLSVEPLDPEKIRRARLVAISVPMHTALRLGVRVAARVRNLNPDVRLVFYGLYAGRFFVVPLDVVLADVRQQIAAGATHVSFGDPDFLNGPGHALAVARALHAEFPAVTFDFTAKIEHLLRQRDHLRELAALGCLFIVSAAESLDDRVLTILDKGHTGADVVAALEATRGAGIALRPTWVAFTPWTTLDGYRAWLDFLAEADLLDAVDPVQYGLRLLVPPGSLLLGHEAMRPHLGPLVAESFYYEWTHPDGRMDALQRAVSQAVAVAADRREDAAATFETVRALAAGAAGVARSPGSTISASRQRVPR